MKKYIAEFIATFALVFCGTGAIIANDISSGAVSLLGIAVTFGFIIMAMIYAVGDISGAHMNPAVTIAFAISGKFKWAETIPYVISQFAGAIIASFALKYLFPEATNLGTTMPSGDPMQSFVIEIFLTFFLMFVILHVATGSKEQGMFAGLAIGAVIILDIMFGGTISGASMNPARSLAPAMAGAQFDHLWVYLTAPFIGAALAVLAYRFLRSS